jgi:hypothetical protein
MDERNLSIFLHGLGRRIGTDATPIVVDVQRAADQNKLVVLTDQVDRSPADHFHESSLVVYCGNARQVSEGFTIALRAMGVEARTFRK